MSGSVWKKSRRKGSRKRTMRTTCQCQHTSTKSRSPTVTLSVVHDTITEQCFAMVLDIYRPPEPLQDFKHSLSWCKTAAWENSPGALWKKIYWIGNEAAVTLTLEWKPHSKKQMNKEVIATYISTAATIYHNVPLFLSRWLWISQL